MPRPEWQRRCCAPTWWCMSSPRAGSRSRQKGSGSCARSRARIMPKAEPPLRKSANRASGAGKMKPVAFDYVRAVSVGHAVEALAEAGSHAKIIAGGQSLMPMINFRLVKPSVLVDINRIPDLDTVEVRGDRVRIGALVRHRTTASDPVIRQEFPVVHEAMKNVAHMTVRNRGTFCGSVCHADPAAEMPMMTLLLDG